MIEKLKELLKDIKTLENAKRILHQNNIDYEFFEGIKNNELKIYNNIYTYRIIQNKNCLEFKTMKKISIGGAEETLKSQLIFEKLSYK